MNSYDVKKGDQICALGHTFTVDRILYQDYWDRFGYDVEFIDDHGRYHHWKQSEDGGQVLRSKKQYTDSYGVDCTDIFEAYGYINIRRIGK